MKLYRMMSEKEFDNVSNTSPFSWKGKCSGLQIIKILYYLG